MLNNIPQELRDLHQWVCWRNVDKKGKKTKIPSGSVSDPNTWMSFKQAITKYENEKYDGVGFVFTEDDPYCFVDLDNCYNGNIAGWAEEIVKKLHSYSEISQSGRGIHVIVKGKIPPGCGNRKANFEIYDHGRYCAMTGKIIDGYPATIESRQEEIEELCAKIFTNQTDSKIPAKISQQDYEILDKIKTSKQGDKFNKLFSGDTSDYKSESEADLALCSILAFYTQDRGQILRILQRSALWDEKWERRDYQERTIAKALASRVENYDRGRENSNLMDKPSKPLQFNLTDMGNGERLVYYHGENIRYCHLTKVWYIWDGKRWAPDDTGEIKRLAKDVVKKIYIEAGNCEDDDQRKAIAEHAKRSESYHRREAMIAMAQSEPGVPITKNQLDADPWLLNCLNGTIDLRTGELLPHRREDLITRLAPVKYDPKAKSELWDTFLQTISDGDQIFTDFLQRAVGYSLTGVTDEEVLFFVHGPASTGKSTFIEAIKSVMGDYAVTADFDSFLKRSRDTGSPRNDIAMLANARLVVSIEVDEGKQLAEGLVKMITGGDTVRARFLYQESFEFLPQLKLWLCANHTPKVKPTDEAMWRRILRLPFQHIIPESNRDPQVKAVLRNPQVAGPAILTWAVKGCLRWLENGLAVPDRVKRATDEYRQEMNIIEAFIKECCIVEKNATVAKQDLFDAYKKYCEDAGEKAEGKITFGRRLKELPYGILDEKAHTEKGELIWRGIKLIHKTF